MIMDQDFLLVDNADMSVSSPDYSTNSIDLLLSPDLGSGGTLVAVVAITGAYVAGSCTAVVMDIVTSSVAALSTTPRVIGSLTVIAADLEFADSTGLDIAAHCAPFVIRANPSHGVTTRDDIAASSVAERYLGLRFTHTTATSTSMFVTAYFTNDYQGDPHNNYGAAGMTIL